MRMTDENYNKIAELIRANKLTLAEIAKQTGYKETTIHRVAEQVVCCDVNRLFKKYGVRFKSERRKQ